LDIRKCFFLISVIEEWNSLPVVLINCNLRKELTAAFAIGDIHKLAPSFFLRDSHLRVPRLVELS